MICRLIAILLLASPAAAQAGRRMEHLNRGVVAVPRGEGGAFVGWRMLGSDSGEVAFNVYRQPSGQQSQRVNDQPIRDVTFFIDEEAKLTQSIAYVVTPVVGGKELPASERFTLQPDAPKEGYLRIPLQTPQGYSPNDASVGDLDGDGQYEIVLHQAGRGRDNSQNGQTDPPILQAYKLNGTRLWEINLGKNIREGAHYTQFMVYDLDSDGRAEIVCKTADGTVDGAGKVIGGAPAAYVNEQGRILKGPEFLTVFDGLTGKVLATTNYIPPRGDDLKKFWGDDYGNRADRFLACVAYLDGVHPSVIMCRGYYTRTVLAAFDWRDGKLTNRWTFDSHAASNEAFVGQGNHNLSVADVDGDGKDEIIYGGCAIDDTGKGLWSTGLGHGDAMHVSDLDPSIPGLEMFRIQERFADAGAHMVELKTGNVLWRKPSVKAGSGRNEGEGPGRGVCFDIDPRYPGSESWTAGAGIEGVWDAKGNQISDVKPPSCNFAVWWDGDLLRELLDKNHVDKWNWESQKAERLLTADDCTSNNGTKATPTLSADILGDWREEIVWPTKDGKELRVYTTTVPTKHRMATLMHDPVYRLGVAWQNVAYNQPPHTSFYMAARPAAAQAHDGMRHFSRKLAEGNYLVTITFGGDEASETTVKAESRRLMLESVRTKPGETVKRTFAVNVRTAQIAGDGDVRTGQRERDSKTWDDELSLEFLGNKAAVKDVEVVPAPPTTITVYLAGDSTVTDQREEPYSSWGAMLPRFFKPSVAVANHAESGRALRSFRAEKRLDKILSTIKPGDYLFIQFGHNDMKEKGEGIGAFTSFKEHLKEYIAAARERGANPVVITSMNRRRFDESGKIVNTFGDYIEATRQVATETNTPLIDLNAMSKTLYEAWGPDLSLKAFVHYPANTFPNQDKPLKDDSHFSAYGGYELAKCVVEGIRQAKLPLAEHLADDVQPFDPATPDPIENFKAPPSPLQERVAPEGR